METKEQTKERRTQVIQKALFHSYSEFSRSLAGALACSDKEANWPFNPETHVVVPRELLEKPLEAVNFADGSTMFPELV